ncbi:hypothetical protein J1N10_05185 [Carboxylicivirga sp. A043]|uniref:DUF6261 family protein n=1 Tax=Carboxylicivirga litoralis TaxID=2816963 RepID=UPI0021CB6880|nr:DUF6261 family protein [Carboxylicivirga sp. A043]MCU4155358.1 hypothetical protein [Carboxylicivirga sp. A043]
MKIEKLMHRSYNGEVATVSESILKASATKGLSDDSFLSDVFQKMGNEEEKLSFAIRQDKTVSELETADDNRDNQLRALYNLSSGYLYHPNETVSAAAHTVCSIFDKYPLSELLRANYAQESALIESLLKDLEADDVKAAIALLTGVAEIIATIRTAQDAFTSTFVAYSEEKAKHNGKDTATKLKSALLKLINNELVIYLRAMAIAAPDTYGDFAAATAQIIADNNDKVRKRMMKKNNVSTEEN